MLDLTGHLSTPNHNFFFANFVALYCQITAKIAKNINNWSATPTYTCTLFFVCDKIMKNGPSAGVRRTKTMLMLENKFTWFIFRIAARFKQSEWQRIKWVRLLRTHSTHSHTQQTHYSHWAFILLLPTIRRCFRKFLKIRAFDEDETVEETERWQDRKNSNTNTHGEKTEAQECSKMIHSDVDQSLMVNAGGRVFEVTIQRLTLSLRLIC